MYGTCTKAEHERITVATDLSMLWTNLNCMAPQLKPVWTWKKNPEMMWVLHQQRIKVAQLKTCMKQHSEPALEISSYDSCGTTVKVKSWGRKALWTRSCTVLFRLQTSEISPNLSVMFWRLDPDAASDIMFKKRKRSASVRACGGIRLILSLAQLSMFSPNALLSDSRT
jgi:hypothetical protein